MSVAAINLYETTDAINTVLNWIEENEEEIIANGGVLPDHIQELLDQAEGDFKTKVERVCLVIRNLKASAAVAQEEAARLTNIRKSFENQAEHLKNYLKQEMKRANERKVKTGRVNTWVQINGSPTLRPKDPENIPAKYRVQLPPPPPSFDSVQALKDLKEAGKIPEVATEAPIELDGILIERGDHLQIR